MWLRISTMLLTLHSIDWIDTNNPKITNLVVNECVVPILKSKLKDMCYIDSMAKEFCHVNLELGTDCEN